MYTRFCLTLVLLSALVLLTFTAFAIYEVLMPEWKDYQTEYRDLLIKKAKDEAAKRRAKALDVKVQQIYLDSLKRVDRCTSCHTGVDNPLMADAKVPFKQHSGDYLKSHPQERFGCTVCHYGQGRATNKREAHGVIPVTQWDYPIAYRLKTPSPMVEYPGAGREIHWDFPIIPLKYIQSSCTQCHDLRFMKSRMMDKIVRGEQLFREKGCRGCHKLNGVGGDIGKALDVVGSQPYAYFPMRYVKGEKTVYAWHKEHLLGPSELVPESEMKAKTTEEESELLTTYVLSLRSEEMPRSYRRIRYTPPERPRDGEGLYKMFCIACHATGKESIYDEVFNRTVPSIMNPPFLKIADDKELKAIIKEGRKGTQMTSWKAEAAGLSDTEIDRIIRYITKKRPKDRARPFEFSKFKGDMKRGEELYNLRCALCHSPKGEGGLGLNLRNPAVQKLVGPEFLAITVRDGRAGTPMPPFGKKGVGLSDQDIVDVVSYVKTLSKKK
ncbi:MAG: c-type cytochrome [Nitrospirota bacterium]